jgi:type I pantothenate kinase
VHLLDLLDAIDVGIYVDAEEADIERWFVDRFLVLRSSGHSFYRQFSEFSDDQASAFARQVWDAINRVNLLEYILPTRELADVVIEKGPDHSMRRIRVPRGNMRS